MNAGFTQTADKTNKITEALNEYKILMGEKNERIKLMELKGYVPGLDMKTDAEIYKKMVEDIKQGIFKIIAMGEFKSGKSTLINSMIGGKIVPAAVVACTAIITVIIYGNFTNRALVYYKDKQKPVEMPLPEFNEKFSLTDEDEETIEKQGYLDRFADVEYAVIECDYALCKNGVRLIDSPGLGEAVSRDKTTRNFVPSANAVIFLLNATQLFSQEEKTYIKENFAGKELKNLFFVVNRINQTDQDELPRTMRKVHTNLKSVFTDDSGYFDEEMYKKRVFFVNAKGALEGKQNRDLSKINTSGVPEFEKELEQFLTSEERLVATFQSTLTSMANSFVRAEEGINNRKIALKTPLEVLEKGRIDSEKILNGLETEIEGIEKTFNAANKIILSKVYQNLIEYINDMEAAWEADSKNLEARIGVKEMFKLAGSTVVHIFNEEKKKKKQEEIIRPLSKAIGNYIDEKFKIWADQIDILIEPELEELRKELKEKISIINLQMGKAVKIFTGTLDGDDTTDGKGPNALQLIISLIQGDVSILVENAAGAGFTWGEYFKKYLIQAIMQIITFSVIGGPIGLVAFLGMELFQMIKGAEDLSERILQSMKTKIFNKLRQGVSSKKEEFEKSIKDEMSKQCQQITEKIRGKVEETKKQQQNIIAEKKKQQFNAEEEAKRLDAILLRMSVLCSKVYYELYSKNLIKSDIYKIASQSISK